MAKLNGSLTLGDIAKKMRSISATQILYTLLLVAVFLIGYLLAKVQGVNTQSVTIGAEELAQAQNGAPQATEKPQEGHLPLLGQEDAKITLIEFADFQCPFCGRFEQDVMSQVKKEYVDTGKVKVYYRHFAFLGQESTWAAEATECAHEQGKFWEYHNHLFNNQRGENEGAFAKENLKQFAANLDLDTQKFNTCLDGGKQTDKVISDTTDGRNAGVTGTPTIFVNGTMLVGAQPYSEVKRVIEEELKK